MAEAWPRLPQTVPLGIASSWRPPWVVWLSLHKVGHASAPGRCAWSATIG